MWWEGTIVRISAVLNFGNARAPFWIRFKGTAGRDDGHRSQRYQTLGPVRQGVGASLSGVQSPDPEWRALLRNLYSLPMFVPTAKEA
jgi:hypothetical protein